MYKQWTYNPAENAYTGSIPHEVHTVLPPGFYSFDLDRFGQPVANRKLIRQDRLCTFKHGPLEEVLQEVRGFWTSNGAYKRLGLTHKRSLLLHGPAGCGKSAIINSIIEDVVARNGIAIQVNDIYDSSFRGVVPKFRQIQPDSQIVAILEDIEQHVLSGDEEELLDLLDGASSVGDGVLFICTTNNLHKIPTRIRCRPSRVDTLIEIGWPSDEQRGEYVQFLSAGAGDILQSSQIEEMVKKTNGKKFSLADMKEVVISVVAFEKTIAESVARLNEAKKEELKQKKE